MALGASMNVTVAVALRTSAGQMYQMRPAGDDAFTRLEASLNDDSITVLGAQSHHPLHERFASYLDIHNLPALNVVDGRSWYHHASLRFTYRNGDSDR